jgi:Ulp1 family protease
MQFDYYEYNIAGHWLSAIIDSDYTGLTDHEERQLDQFMNNLPVIGHWDIDDDNPAFSIDEVSGDYAETYKAKLLFEV